MPFTVHLGAFEAEKGVFWPSHRREGMRKTGLLKEHATYVGMLPPPPPDPPRKPWAKTHIEKSLIEKYWAISFSPGLAP